MSEIIKEEKNVLVIPKTDIVASMADEFKAELKALIQETSCDLTLDLTGVEIVDSVGIGVIIATHNSLKNKGKKLKVINISVNIYSLLNTMNLGRHFTIEKVN